MHGMALQGAKLRHHNGSHGTSEQQAVTTDVQTLLEPYTVVRPLGLGTCHMVIPSLTPPALTAQGWRLMFGFIAVRMFLEDCGLTLWVALRSLR